MKLVRHLHGQENLSYKAVIESCSWNLRRISTYRKYSADWNGKDNFPRKGTENFPLLISTLLYGQERKTVC